MTEMTTSTIAVQSMTAMRETHAMRRLRRYVRMRWGLYMDLFRRGWSIPVRRGDRLTRRLIPQDDDTRLVGSDSAVVLRLPSHGRRHRPWEQPPLVDERC